MKTLDAGQTWTPLPLTGTDAEPRVAPLRRRDALRPAREGRLQIAGARRHPDRHARRRPDRLRGAARPGGRRAAYVTDSGAILELGTGGLTVRSPDFGQTFARRRLRRDGPLRRPAQGRRRQRLRLQLEGGPGAQQRWRARLVRPRRAARRPAGGPLVRRIDRLRAGRRRPAAEHADGESLVGARRPAGASPRYPGRVGRDRPARRPRAASCAPRTEASPLPGRAAPTLRWTPSTAPAAP